MTIAYTGNVTSNATYAQTCSTSATAINVTAGNLLVCVVNIHQLEPSTAHFTDSRGNTWTERADSYRASGEAVGIFTAIAKDSGSLYITVDPPGTTVYYIAVACIEISGQASETPDDTVSDASGSSTDAHAGSVDLSAAGIVIGACGQNNTDVACTPDANWDGSPYDNDKGTNVPGLVVSYRIDAAGSYNDGWTYASSRPWAACAVTFLESAAAAGIIPLVMANRRLLGA